MSPTKFIVLVVLVLVFISSAKCLGEEIADRGDSINNEGIKHEAQSHISVKAEEIDRKRGWWDSVKEAAEQAASTVKEGAQKVGDTVKEGAQKAGEVVTEEANKAWDAAQQAWETAKGGSKDAASSLSEAAQQLLNKLPFKTISNSNAFDEFEDTLKDLVQQTYANTHNVSVIKLVYSGYEESLDWTAKKVAERLHISPEDAKKLIKITVISTAGRIAVFFIVPEVLPFLGFTESGVAGGSVASVVQSVIYGGETSGLFSILQSAGALGISTSARVALAFVVDSFSFTLQWGYKQWW